MYTNRMSRKRATAEERAHGVRLGQLIAVSRQQQGQSASELSIAAGVSIDALRSLEIGRVPMPSFLTVARLARALGLDLDSLHSEAARIVKKGRSRS